MKKNVFIILLLSIFFISCWGKEEDTRRKKKQGTPEDTTIPPPLSRAERKVKNHAIFLEFWSDFQEGVFGKKKEILVNLVQFPFVGDFTCDEMFDKKQSQKQEKQEKKDNQEKEDKKNEPPKRKPISKEVFLKCIETELDKCLIKAVGEANTAKVEKEGLLEFEYLPETKEEKGKKNQPKPKNIKPTGKVSLQFKIIAGQWKLTGLYLKGSKPDNCPN
ncbi:MAG: hypothetical protein EAZ20_07065 [Bacteroidetes bacterium]|nr:MAG: hypothetical protein EAZ20_07065 [Bacteroidota bacterium]